MDFVAGRPLILDNMTAWTCFSNLSMPSWHDDVRMIHTEGLWQKLGSDFQRALHQFCKTLWQHTCGLHLQHNKTLDSWYHLVKISCISACYVFWWFQASYQIGIIPSWDLIYDSFLGSFWLERSLGLWRWDHRRSQDASVCDNVPTLTSQCTCCLDRRSCHQHHSYAPITAIAT